MSLAESLPTHRYAHSRVTNPALWAQESRKFNTFVNDTSVFFVEVEAAWEVVLDGATHMTLAIATR